MFLILWNFEQTKIWPQWFLYMFKKNKTILDVLNYTPTFKRKKYFLKFENPNSGVYKLLYSDWTNISLAKLVGIANNISPIKIKLQPSLPILNT